MQTKVLYVTSEDATIITLLPDDLDVRTMTRHGQRHPKESLGRNHSKQEGDVEKFLCEVAESLEKDASRILIVGPAQAKIQLMNHLLTKHSDIANRVVGVETIDKSSIPQVVHFARNYFTKLGAFDAI